MLKLVLASALLIGGLCHATNTFSEIDKSTLNEEELKVLEFIRCVERDFLKDAQISTLVEWAYYTNINEETEKKRLDRGKKSDLITLKAGLKGKTFDADKVHNPELKRALKDISNIGKSALPKDEREKYNMQANKIASIFGKAKVPKWKEPETLIPYTPDIRQVFTNSRDPEELEYYWTQFRELTGPEIRPLYLDQLKYDQKIARLNGYEDAAVADVSSYESETFIEDIKAAYEGLIPLYEQLHAYARHRLMKKYPDLVTADGPIPVHLVGHNDGIQWGVLSDLLLPYPEKPSIDATPGMKEQEWSVKRMFTESEDFFLSIGFPKMTEEFWRNSIFERPEGREMQCHASAWDFYTKNDFRIKMCSKADETSFITATHEMGHTHYQMAYSNQSVLHRTGANPGFHEAVADIQSLATRTVTNYKRLGLIGEDVDEYDEETNINALMSVALNKVSFMPYAYILDRWHWDLLQGKVDPEDINCHWHKLRHDIQGVSPPNKRNEVHMDTGAKYHIAAGVSYVRYFTAALYQYQFYEAMCLASGDYVPEDPKKPLHMCNFYGSKAAGDKLMTLLKQGASRPWPEIMEEMTGTPKMDSSAYRKYFKTLEDWLVKENERNGVTVGWTRNYEDFCSK